jgi:hypothetical protein
LRRSLAGNTLAQLIWAAGTLPAVAALLVSMVRDLLAGRLVSMRSRLCPCRSLLAWERGLLAWTLPSCTQAATRSRTSRLLAPGGRPQCASRSQSQPQARPTGHAGRSRAELREDHERLEVQLNRLREIADALDDAEPPAAVTLIGEANGIVAQHVLAHERDDESAVYPRLAKFLSDEPTRTSSKTIPASG